MPFAARHLMILGRVQGVFYRNWTMDTARGLGLAGWVRNRMDGSVETWVEGELEAIEQFIALAHKGPPAADVAHIEAREVEPEDFGSFQKRPTA